MSSYNEVVKDEDSDTTKWLTCLSCGEPLTKVDTKISCIQPHYRCDKCNIVVDGEIGQLYHCCRCDKVVEQYEELIFEFITPNWKELGWCPKPTGIKQYLCKRCHDRAIKPRRFKRIRQIPFYP